MTHTELARLLSTGRFSLVSEKHTQADIEQFLTERRIEYSREHRIPRADGSTDIPDFLIDGIVVECKANSAKANQTIRQLARYAEHAEVTAILLVSNRAMLLPTEINNKPVLTISTGRAWM